MKEKLSIKDLEFYKDVPAPVPGYFYMNMIPDSSSNHTGIDNPFLNSRKHSSALDADHKRILTPITETFPIDVLKEMLDMENQESSTWLRKGTQIDTVFYQEKSDRNQILLRDEFQDTIKEVVDFEKYLEDTFEQVKVPISDVVEEYPLVPSKEVFSIFFGITDNQSPVVNIESGSSTLVDRCKISDLDGKEINQFDCTKLSIEDKLCLQVKDGKAYFSPVTCIYKLSKSKNNHDITDSA